MILEALARLSAGRQWAITVPGTGERVLPGEIAALLAGCDQLGSDLLLAKYALDPHATISAQKMWTEVVTRRYRDVKVRVYKWHMLSSGTLEHWIKGDGCGRCDGVGEVTWDAKIIKCPACEGTGRRPKSNREKLKAIGIGALANAARAREWAARYDECMDVLERVAEDAERCMLRNKTGNKKGRR